MVRIIKAGRTFRAEKGVVIYVGTDASVKAELIQQPKLITVDKNNYSCVIFISEEDKQWQQQ
jgi:hypothetical protein